MFFVCDPGIRTFSEQAGVIIVVKLPGKSKPIDYTSVQKHGT
jgi:hypothetical protein